MSHDPFTGRHRHTMSNRNRAITAYIVALTLAGIAILAILCVHPMGTNRVAPSGQASPHQIAVTAQTTTARAYQAFTTWERHPTRVHLDQLVTDSFALPAKYTASDITQLAADVLGGAPKTDLARDRAYVDQDLTAQLLPMAS